MKTKWNERLTIYDALVDQCPRFERKGKTMPYTSANGYMFSLLNKDAELGIRFEKEDQKDFIEKHNTTVFKSYGAVMKGYVLVPNQMMEDSQLLIKYLNKSYDYVMSLIPK